MSDLNAEQKLLSEMHLISPDLAGSKTGQLLLIKMKPLV